MRQADGTASERCSSADYNTCPAVKQHHEERPTASRCPFLHESLVQYCSAAPVTKFIPYSESVITRCGNDNHRYCEAYLALANPGDAGGAGDDGDGGDVQVPERLMFSPNHLWLDVSDDGNCHVGIDGVFARVLGRIDRVTFLTPHGVHRPTAVLTVCGVDLQLMFPNTVSITGTNVNLRLNPQKPVTGPYTAGWLFEGRETEQSRNAGSPVARGLIGGTRARTWIRNEMERLTTFVHRLAAAGENVMADGGEVMPGVMDHMKREDILHLFNEFFSPFAGWRS